MWLHIYSTTWGISRSYDLRVWNFNAHQKTSRYIVLRRPISCLYPHHYSLTCIMSPEDEVLYSGAYIIMNLSKKNKTRAGRGRPVSVHTVKIGQDISEDFNQFRWTSRYCITVDAACHHHHHHHQISSRDSRVSWTNHKTGLLNKWAP